MDDGPLALSEVYADGSVFNFFSSFHVIGIIINFIELARLKHHTHGSVGPPPKEGNNNQMASSVIWSGHITGPPVFEVYD